MFRDPINKTTTRTHDRLLASFRQAALAGNVAVLFLLTLCGYLALTAFHTTHLMLFVGTELTLPALDRPVPLRAFYLYAPILLLLVHGAVLLQYYLIARQRSVGWDYVESMAPPAWVLVPANLPLFSFFRPAFGWFGKAVLHSYEFIVLLLAPMTTLLALEAMFLPYHDTAMTAFHASVIAADLAIASLFLLYTSQFSPRFLRFAMALLIAVVSVWVNLCLVLPLNESCADSTLLFGKVDRHLSLPGVQASGLSLAGRDFSCADFDDSMLEDLEIGGTRVVGATFRKAILRRITFESAPPAPASYNADWSQTDFRDAEIEETRLASIDLHGSDMRRLEARDLSFDGSNLAGVLLDGAKLEAVRFDRAILDRSSLRLSYGIGIQARWVRARGSDFTGAIWPLASFRSGRFTAARFNRTLLPFADFGNAQMAGSELLQADLTGARGLTPDGVMLRGAKLPGSCLCEECDARTARWNSVDLRNAHLPGLVGTEAVDLAADLQATEDRIDWTKLAPEARDLWKQARDGALEEPHPCQPSIEQATLVLFPEAVADAEGASPEKGSTATVRAEVVYDSIAEYLLIKSCEDDGSAVAESLSQRILEDPPVNPWLNRALRRHLEVPPLKQDQKQQVPWFIGYEGRLCENLQGTSLQRLVPAKPRPSRPRLRSP